MRSRLHDDIQRLHGNMPLWGVDRWVSLGDLFVDVNILELTSSNRRSELDDLWQDFTRNNSDYSSLDRIGLGNQQQRVSGLAVLERHTNLMVVGKPGSGKTTYLQRIVTECNEGKLKANRIPLLIKLREFVDDGHKYDYNLKQFLKHQWRLSNTDIELILNQGLALILLDGLDEVTGEARKQITKEIKLFVRSYPQVQIIVTCRTQSQESKFDRFDYIEVADFNEKQVIAFADHWFRTVCKNVEEENTKAQKFLSQLFREENKPIRELAITPILLSLTCAVFQQTGKFYSKRSKLYEEGLELLLEKWDKSREVERDKIYRDLSVERKLELLSYVAVKKFEQNILFLFEQEELEVYIGIFLGIESHESRRVLKEIESQHGLLIERAYKVWSFSHLTFQEFLVAKYIVHISIDKKLLQHFTSHIFKSQWRQILILTVEIMRDPSEMVLMMKEQVEKSQISKSIHSFICWIHEKSLEVKAGYCLLAIRALYIDFYKHWLRGEDTKLAEKIDSKISSGLMDYSYYEQTNNFRISQTLYEQACPFRLDKNLKIALECANSFENVLNRFLDYCNFEETEKIDNDSSYTEFEDYYDGYLFSDEVSDLAIFLDESYKDANKINKELADEIDKLGIFVYKSIPEDYDTIEDWVDYRDWWRNNKDTWISTFIYLIRKHRKLFTIELSETEKLNLEKYRYANELIIDCLNIGNLDQKNKKYIEETLLLPIAEIEKRKQLNS